MTQEKLNNVKSLLSGNKLKEAFELSTEIFWTSSYQKDIIIINGKFVDIEQQYLINGKLSYEDYSTQKAKVVNQLLELVSNVKLEDFLNSLTMDSLKVCGLARITNILFEKVKKVYDGDAKIIGDEHAFKMYADALSNVKNRFLTTSYIDSHFWVNQDTDIEIVRVNENLVDRMSKENKVASESMRRIFLVPGEINGYISNKVDVAVSKFKEGNREDFDELKLIIKNLESMAKNISMKIIDINYLPRPIRRNNKVFFNPKESFKEIALYDDFRLDIFNLDPNKRINSTRIISNKCEDFSAISQRIYKYFQDTWSREECKSIEYFLKVIKAELNYQMLSKVDYDAEWLIKYDHLLRSKDYILGSEKSSLLGYLDKTEKHYRNHLDIGVCTGRYPEELKNKELVTNSYSIDLDSDVADWMAKFRKDVPFLKWDIRLPSVIKELNTSFNVSRYDLITCMVSTMSHFNKKDTFAKFDDETGFIKGVENIGYLLCEDGIMVVSTWSNFDTLRNKEIDLYDSDSIDYLEKHTPTIDEIMNVLNRKNKNFIFDKQLDNDKFNIYIIRKQSK